MKTRLCYELDSREIDAQLSNRCFESKFEDKYAVNINNNRIMSSKAYSNDLGPHICVKLISLVKQHPKIYVPSSETSVRSRNKRNELNEIWEKIAVDVGIPAEDCKRRWRTLKDVYAKICKRRLQEGVLGIKTKKEWLYEQDMSFLKFLFEEPYEEVLENVEEVNLEDWKNSDATEELFSNSIGESKINPSSDVEDQDDSDNGTIEYLDLDPLADSSMANKIPPGRSEAWKDSHSPGIRAKSRFRAIRPKPYELNLLDKNRGVINGNIEASIVNVAIPSPRKILASSPAPGIENNRDTMILSSLNRIDRSKCLPVLDKGKTPLEIDLKKSSSNSVELFFKSMARSVMKLPTAVQADIKLDICKIVTRAEIQYSSSQSERNGNS